MFELRIGQDGSGHAPHLVLVQETQPEAQAGAPGATHARTDRRSAREACPSYASRIFSPQIIWLAISFVLLLILMSKVAMPRVASAIEQRETRIKGDLDRAERVKIEADTALAAYQKTIADARAKAQGELRQTQAEIAAETAKREAAFGQQMAQRTKAAEDGIAQAKTRALTDLRGVGGEITGSVLAKVAGLRPPAAQIQAAVDAAMTER